MFRKFKDHAGSHDENRAKVCFICFIKKKKVVNITTVLKNHIQKITSYNAEDNRLPSALFFCTIFIMTACMIFEFSKHFSSLVYSDTLSQNSKAHVLHNKPGPYCDIDTIVKL